MTAPSTSSSTLFRAVGEAEAATEESEAMCSSPVPLSAEFRNIRRTATSAPAVATLSRTNNAFIVALRRVPLNIWIIRERRGSDKYGVASTLKL
ncbi:hypothetical protein Psi01_45580 [Planobispora siamensis]|uniref:Uncharacterized protein n=1 Tax=Planobispora siamensis TaxID=936338 RepID=A0A8J3SQN7_9ACTN|nr:hypothetical protein Psi01_45580 [Planobispora siamensis]